MNFEMFCDDAFFHMWAVRPEGDRDFRSPQLIHFNKKEDAEQFKNLAEKGIWAIKNE